MSEIDVQIIVAALDQPLHLLLTETAGIGESAAIRQRLSGDLRQPLQEDFLGNETLLAGETVGAVVLDAQRNVQRDCIYCCRLCG